MAIGPRTQTIAFSWRPELRFYEQQFELLRELDDKGALRAFRVGDSQVEGRLFSTEDEIAIGQAGMRFELLSPSSDVEQAWQCVGSVLERLQPQVQGVTARFQYVEALDRPFEEAVSRGQETLSNAIQAPGVSISDWALLLDLQLSEPWRSAGQFEYGIVRAYEVPPRLARMVGRISDEEPRALNWSPEDFAEVSLFADARVTGEPVTSEPSDKEQSALAAARQFWEAAENELAGLVKRLKATLVEADQLTGRQEGGGSA